jgi:hypothetical protein
VPLLVVLAVALVVMLLAIALMPVALVQRYRTGTARRLARRWLATVNMVGFAVSAALFLAGAAVTSIWVAGAFGYALLGLGAGCVLGVFGLALSRWESTPQGLHYTPNRWLVLAITLVVTARVLYGFWRGWESWRLGLNEGSWVVASGVAGSLAAGAVVLGYYLMFWAGVRWRATGPVARSRRDSM